MIHSRELNKIKMRKRRETKKKKARSEVARKENLCLHLHPTPESYFVVVEKTAPCSMIPMFISNHFVDRFDSTDIARYHA